MAADGNTGPISEKRTIVAQASGDQPQLMPVIVPETTGAISPVALTSIGKPNEGTIRVIDTGNSPELNFSFDQSDVKLTALDVDLVMIFKDNSKIILPSLAMDLVGGNPPKLKFNGTVVSAQSVVSMIGHTDLVDIAPSVQLSSLDFLPKKKGGNTNESDQSTTGQNGIGGGEPPVPPQPVVSGAKSGKTSDNDGAKTAEFTAPPVEKVQPGLVATAGSTSALANPSVISTTKAEPLNNANAYSFSDISIVGKMYQIVEKSPQQQDTGSTHNFSGGSGTSPANTDSSFAAQNKAETLVGTAGNDEIWADNRDYSAGGMAGRVISITPSVPGTIMTSLTITGVSGLYKILGATLIGGNDQVGYSYSVSPYALGTSEFQFKLAYTLPDQAQSSNSSFSLQFSGTSSDGKVATAKTVVYFKVTQVTSDSEQVTTDPKDGRTVFNLSLMPAGNSVSGGAGDDTIHAAAGADTIDGGSGNNFVAYDLSRLGVSVNLKTGLGSLGFAAGDTYTNIHNVIGSTNSDTIIGDDAGDTINGNGGHDSLMGGSGNDYFYSNGLGNTIDGGDGYNKVDFSNSATAITVNIGTGLANSGDANSYDVIKNIQAIVGTSHGDDMLISGSTPTSLFAGAGNDTVVSGPARDTLDGGDGTDTLSYRTSNAGVSVNLATNKVAGGYATNDMIQNFENLTGSDYNDTLIGSAGDNQLDGRGGDDSLDGGGGNDTLLGGTGNDTILSGTGTSSIDAGADNDVILASNGQNTIDGGTGIDTVDYSSASASFQLSLVDSDYSKAYFFSIGRNDLLTNVENIIGSSGDDTILGNSANNSIDGRDGNDCLSGGYGNDTLDGGAGDNWISYDYLSASGGPYRLQVAGSIAIHSTISGTETDIVQNIENLVGSSGDDLIIGDERKNSLYGGEGNDTFIGGGGSDSIDGQGGTSNTVSYASKVVNGVVLANSDAVSVDLSIGVGTGGLALGDRYNRIQNVIGSSGNDSIKGDSDGNLIVGGAGADSVDGFIGDDTILGGDGNDLLVGNWGNDSIDGGDGSDTVDYSYLDGSGIAVTLSMTNGEGANTFHASASAADQDTLVNIEKLQLTQYADTVDLSGATIDLYLESRGGSDTITTGSGNDTINASASNSSNDVIINAGEGSNSITIGSGLSSASSGQITSGSGDDTITSYATNNTITSGDGTDQITVVGTGNQSIIGGNGDKKITINGSGGAVTLTVGTGNDTITLTGSGTDSITGGHGDNKVDLSGTSGTVSVVLGNGQNSVTGGSGYDVITLGNGGNTVDGHLGIDSITSGAGNDSLLGGAGNDTFSAGYGTNTIDGGAGTLDTVDYSFLNAVSGSVSITATDASAFSATGAGSGTATDTINNVEVFVGTTGNDTMDMRLATGNLSLAGNSGNDSFIGGQGNDTIDGGADIDTVDYSAATTNVTLTMGADAITFQAKNATPGSIGSDTLINIEKIKLTANNDSVDLSTATANLTLTSGGGGDTITTGSGNDLIDASASMTSVLLSGGNGNDTIIGGSAADSLSGGAGNDSLVGNPGAEVGNPGADTIDGGDGFDTVGYDYVTTDRTITATNSTTFTVGAAEKLINIEAIIGGSGNDFFDMTNVATVNLSLAGGGGNDTFKSGGGTDTLSGGDGNDLYFVNNASDQIIEGNGSGSGNDTVYASGNSFNLATNGANVEQLYHRDYSGNTLATAFTGIGNELDNLISGGTGSDCLAGGGGNDSFYSNGGNDTIYGDAGSADLVDFSFANANATKKLTITETSDGHWTASVTVGGNVFTDILDGIEALIGTGGDDTFRLNEGGSALTINGNGGNDLVSYDQLGTSTSISLTLANGAASVALAGATNRTDSLIGIENVTGGAGNDTIIGDGANNVLSGQGGKDSIDGGSGNDTADYSYVQTGAGGLTVSLNLDQAALASVSASDTDTLKNIENIIGTRNADCIQGDGANNSISGGDGNDTLAGGAGNDTLDGGSAIGTSDRVDFTYVAANQTLSITGSSTTWSASVGLNDQDTLYNFEAITLGKGTNIVNLSGITYGVTIDGSQGQSDSIATGTGNDSLLGGAHNDTFSGGGGNDTIDGGATPGDTDLVDYSWIAAGKSVTITAANAVSWNYTDSDGKSGQLLNIEAIKGSAGNDRIDLSASSSTASSFSVDGGAGNDTLTGGAGNDTLVDLTGNNFFDGGGAVNISTANIAGGTNSMSGGAGNDTYLSHSVNDKISDTGGNNVLQTDAFNSINLNDTTPGTVGAMLSAVASANTKWTLQYVGTGNFTGIGDDKGDSIYGANGDDLLTGGKGSDQLIGYYGNNTIDGGGLSTDGADTLVAYGNGNNVFVVRHAGDVVTIDPKGLGYGVNTVSTVINNVNLSTSQGFTNLVYIGAGSFTGVGSADNNSIGGSTANDCIDGFSGNDTVQGGGGNDTLIGGIGNDSVVGGAGNDLIIDGSGNETNGIDTGSADTLIGGGGNDIFYISSSLDSIVGGVGIDTIRTLLSSYTLAGSTQIDNLSYADKNGAAGAGSFTGTGNDLNNTITGGKGNDSLSGAGGADSLNGGDGNNTLSGGDGNDTLNGGAFNNGGGYNVADYSYITSSANLNVTLAYLTTSVSVSASDSDILNNFIGLIGGAGNDTFIGGDNNGHYFAGGLGNDSLLGNSAAFTGNDTLIGGIGNDTLDGGKGIDVADYSYVGDTTNSAAGGAALKTGLTVTLNGINFVNATVDANLDVDQIRNIENIIGTQFGDSIVGDTLANSIFGGKGNDTIQGGTGNAGGNVDTLDGGDGIDTYNVSVSAAAVTVTLGNGAASGSALGQIGGVNFFSAVLSNFENVTTGTGNDIITGNTSDNRLDGQGGNDSINGGGGNDTLIGNTGNDTLDGGGQVGDTADYSYVAGATGLSVALANTPFTASVAANDIDLLSNIENIVGTKNNDTIFGDSNANSLFGGLGDDSFSGGGGNDSIDGGDGTDTIDYSYLNSGTGGVTITQSGSATAFLASAAINDVDQLQNIEMLQLSSNADSVNLSIATSNLSISADAGNDTVIGGIGNDTISGGTGANSLDGGGGTNTLSFENAINKNGAFDSPWNWTTVGNTTISNGVVNTTGATQIVYQDTGNGIIAGHTYSFSFSYSITAGAGLRLTNGTVNGINKVYNSLNLTGTGTITGTFTALANGIIAIEANGLAFTGSIDNFYIYDASLSGITANLSTGLATGTDGLTSTFKNFVNLVGSVGDDRLTGDLNANLISAGVGNDILIGGSGNDTLDGGAGSDTVDYSYVGDGSNAALGGGGVTSGLTLTLNGSTVAFATVATGDFDSVVNVENVIGTKFADSITGDFNANTLSGGASNDTLDGGQGSDWADYTYAGGSNLVASSQAVNAGFNTFSLSVGSDGNDVDRLVNIEAIRLGNGNNTVNLSALTSSAFGITVDGSAGKDSILGGAGNDSLLGGATADSLSGGLGSDTLDGGQGNDIADYSYAPGVTLTASNFTSTATGVSFSINAGGTDIDRLVNIEWITLGTGNNIANFSALGASYGITVDGSAGGMDSLLGGLGNDSLLGGNGADTLSSGSTTDADTLSGGGGNDLYIISSSGDSITGEAAGTGAGFIDTVQIQGAAITGYTLANGNNIENLTYAGAAAFTGAGNELDNSITGNTNNDVLSGGDGNDILSGGAVTTFNRIFVGAQNFTALNGGGGWWANGGNTLGGINVASVALDPTTASALQVSNTNMLQSTTSYTPGAATAANIFFDNTLSVAGATYQLSYVMKVAGSSPWVQITSNSLGNSPPGAGNGDANFWVNINLSTGQIGNYGSSIHYGDITVNATAVSGWYKITIAGTSFSNTRAIDFRSIEADNAFVGGNYASTGSTTINIASATNVLADGADSLDGGKGNDSLFGNFGNDTLSGGAGNDTMDGGAGIDLVSYAYVNAANGYSSGITVSLNAGGFSAVTVVNGSDVDQLINIDNLIGTAFADSLMGDKYANSINGGDGADTLSGGVGNDTLDGGNALVNNSGIDWADYAYVGNIAGQTTGVTATLNGAGGTAAVSLSTGTDVDTLINIENISGSKFADCLTGDTMNNYLKGGLGNDTLSGGSDGKDTLDGNGSGVADSGSLDVVSFGYVGSSVGLTLDLNNFNGATPYTYSVGGSSTNIAVLMNFEGIIGGAGNDSFVGDANNNYLAGGLGNDTLSGGAGNNTLDGGNGIDVVNYSNATSDITITLSAAATVSLSGTYGNGAFSDTLINIEGIITGSGNDSVLGDANNNYFGASLGNDTFDGGAGFDIVDYSYMTTGVSVRLSYDTTAGAMVTNTVSIGSNDIDQLINIEGIMGGSGNDTLSISSINTANKGFSINGAGGDDYIYLPGAIASAQVYWLDGGSGNNTLDGSQLTFSYIDLSATTMPAVANVKFLNGYSPVAFVANFISYIGNGAGETIVGGSQNNSIASYGGNDTIQGGLGNDTLDGGTGSDVVDYSYVDYGSGYSGTTGLLINLTPSTDLSGTLPIIVNTGMNNDIDNLYGFEGVIGTKYNDTLIGNGSAGYFDGGAGNDSIKGGAGADTIRGGIGNDALDGGGGNNTVDYGYLVAGQTVSISVTNATTWTANVSGSGPASGETDSLLNFNGVTMGNSSAVLNFNASSLSVALTATGGYGADTFIGGSGNDSFNSGYGGNDSLDGKGGNDTLDLGGILNTIYGTETVIMNGANGTMTGSVANSTVTFSNFEYILLGNSNPGNQIGNGYGLGDRFIGSSTASNIYVFGGYGADTLDDGGGAGMTLEGQTDNDIYFIRSATTQINEWSFDKTYGTIDLVNTTLNSINLSAAQYGGGNQIENLTYLDATASLYDTSTNSWNTTTLGSGNFTGLGNELNNSITGGYGNNSLVGGAGSDTLAGNIGNDYLRGGDATTGTDSANRAANTNALNNWAQTNAGIAVGNTNTVLAPDGSQTADIISSNATANVWHGVAQNFTNLAGNGATYKFQIYAHLATTNAAQAIQVGFAGASLPANFVDLNLVTGNVTYNASSALNDVTALANGWYLITITGAGTAFGTGTVYVNVLDTDPGAAAIANKNNYAYTGTGKGVVLWGGTFQALDGADLLNGGAGNDTLQGGNGNDTMDGGGGGLDVADYSYITTGLTLNMANFDSTSAYQTVAIATGDVDQVRNFEGFITGSGNDNLTGDSARNYFFSDGGNDTILGGLGSDTISGGTGNDSLDGNGTATSDGTAVDVLDYSYYTGTTGMTVNIANIASATGYNYSVAGSTTDVDTVRNFEGIIGGSGNDSFTGDSHANYIGGGAGDDTIDATSGGADTLLGGAGNDVLKLDWSSLNLSNVDGGAGTDTVVLTGTGTLALNFTASAFTGVLTNAEYLDFSNATSSNNVSVNLDGAGIQKILTGTTSNGNAGVLDLKLDTGTNDTLTLAANGNYSYWTAASGGTQISNGSSATTVNLTGLNQTGSDIYVFDSTHTTLLADLHYHV